MFRLCLHTSIIVSVVHVWYYILVSEHLPKSNTEAGKAQEELALYEGAGPDRLDQVVDVSERQQAFPSLSCTDWFASW